MPVLALALLALLELLVAWRLEPPRVRPVDAPLAEFSAARVRQLQARLFPGSEPHPAGTPAQERARARLIEELTALGLSPRVQSGVACGKEGVCAELHNVLAELPGQEAGIAAALAAHYDSVPAGPGAGDDGQGVASLLELARALRSAPLRRSVWLLFTDGEELGLLGARLFAAEHPLAAGIPVVFNLEARGTRGPSLMFETSRGGGWLVQHYGRAPRPVATSLFGAVYRTLPNDTDLTVFTQRGWQGLNFAFVGGVENYHTSRDTLEAVDWRSVQHQGDAALATLRSLVAVGVQPPGRELVYFDVLSLGLVTLPASWMLPLGLASLLLLGWSLRRELQRRPAYAASLGRAALALLCAWGMPLAASSLLSGMLGSLGAVPFPVIDCPWPFLMGQLLLVAAGQALAVWISRSTEQRLALWDVTWLVWGAAGVLLALRMPEASYVLILPAFLAASLRLVTGVADAARPSAVLLAGALTASSFWLPLLTLLPSVLHLSAASVWSVALAVGLSPLAPVLAPLLESRPARGGLLAAGAASMLAQAAWAPYSPDVPQRVPIVLETDADGNAHWLADGTAGPLPPSLRAAAPFSELPGRPHPWPVHMQGMMYVAPANVARAPALAPRVVALGPRSLRVELELPSSLWALGVRLDGGARLEQARWRGKPVVVWREPGRQRFLLVPGDERAVSFDLDFDSEHLPALDVLAIELGLPEAGQALLEARGPGAVSSGSGDLSVVHWGPDRTQ